MSRFTTILTQGFHKILIMEKKQGQNRLPLCICNQIDHNLKNSLYVGIYVFFINITVVKLKLLTIKYGGSTYIENK